MNRYVPIGHRTTDYFPINVVSNKKRALLYTCMCQIYDALHDTLYLCVLHMCVIYIYKNILVINYSTDINWLIIVSTYIITNCQMLKTNDSME